MERSWHLCLWLEQAASTLCNWLQSWPAHTVTHNPLLKIHSALCILLVHVSLIHWPIQYTQMSLWYACAQAVTSILELWYLRLVLSPLFKGLGLIPESSILTGCSDVTYSILPCPGLTTFWSCFVQRPLMDVCLKSRPSYKWKIRAKMSICVLSDQCQDPTCEPWAVSQGDENGQRVHF